MAEKKCCCEIAVTYWIVIFGKKEGALELFMLDKLL